ncbi:TetR/AcrR family transcriptional regulator [Mycobacterium sp.]|uniref:TetR/AcrR family transcriptional regulator n=1 Tax=Mycobacterium sp. TaxID=1785 RepID=UPI003D6A2C0B
MLSAAIELLVTDGAEGFTTRNVARRAQTSTPAVYELFGDKGGLLREVFFSGFRRLREAFDALEPVDDPVDGLIGLAYAYRTFARDNQMLVEIMFSRPFIEFEPGPEDLAATASVRAFVVDAVQRCIDARLMAGDATDIAHIFVVLAQGLAAAENSRRLGESTANVDRRWDLAMRALVNGLAP